MSDVTENTPTPNVPPKAPKAPKARTKKVGGKGSKWSFARVNLGRGTRLYSTFYPNQMAVVMTDRTVKFRGKEMTLTAAAKILATKKGKRWPSIQGPFYWRTGKGDRLTDMVN